MRGPGDGEGLGGATQRDRMRRIKGAAFAALPFNHMFFTGAGTY